MAQIQVKVKDSDQNMDLPVPLNTSAYAFVGDFCAYALTTKTLMLLLQLFHGLPKILTVMDINVFTNASFEKSR